MREDTLPETLHELLSLALDDLEQTERKPGFRIVMNDWIVVADDGVCEVCLAGAMLVNRLGCIPALSSGGLWTKEMPPSLLRKCEALDHFRRGSWWLAACKVGREEEANALRDKLAAEFSEAAEAEPGSEPPPSIVPPGLRFRGPTSANIPAELPALKFALRKLAELLKAHGV